jgi:Xaa-Pro dipeptidase
MMKNPIIMERQHQLQALIREHKMEAVVLNPGPDLSYLTGLNFHLMERPVVGIFPSEGPPVLILPELEGAKVAQLDYELTTYFYNEDQSTWTSVFHSALTEAGLEKAKMGAIPRHLRLLELSYLESACPELEIHSGQEILQQMRMIKGDDEIAFMEEAVRIAECALSCIIPRIKTEMTEKELAAKLVNRLFFEGSDPELPFFPIVSFGENTANPHASPTNRPLKEGDLVLIDWGASHQGYYSDITRTYVMGDANPELEQIARFVLEANAAGRGAVKPGIPTSEVDRAARQVIDKAGYGEFFIHRTGHGLGREGHEEPYISQFDQTILEPGMTFTIEPGIYLPGRGGVRIEDDVVVTKDGCRSLTDMPREILQLLIED